MGKRLLFKVLGAALAALLVCSAAHATGLSPDGTAGSLTGFTQTGSLGNTISLNGTSYTFVDSVSGTITDGPTSAGYTSYVYKANDGTLAFIDKLTNNGTGALSQVAMRSFGDTVTAAGYAVGVGTAPASVSETTSGTVQFAFNNSGGNSEILPNSSTELIIETNATTYSGGGIAFTNDGNSNNGPAFAPGPEPSSLILMAGSFLGIGGGAFWRRRKMRKVTA